MVESPPTAPDACWNDDRRNDPACFEQSFRHHYPVVRGYARRLTGDPDDADDVTQLAFVRAWKRRRQFRPGTSLRRWLLGIAVHAVLDQRRARARYPVVPLRDDFDAPDTRDDDAREYVERERQRRLLREGVATLTPRQRVAVEARLNGDTDDEIARRLGVKPGAVRALVHRAARDLRERIAQEGATV